MTTSSCPWRWLALCWLCLAGPLAAGENLVANPDFSAGLAPWNATFAEPNETKYARNHQWVEVVAAPGAKGQAVKFSLNGAVAASEGVKLSTPLIPLHAEGGQRFEFGADILTEGPSLIIFFEGYQVDATQQDKGNDHFAGYARSYRATLFVKDPPGKWATVRREITLPKQAKYLPSHALLKLYAFHPAGTAYFRNVYLRPLPPAPAK
jgi:hypothetical protein